MVPAFVGSLLMDSAMAGHQSHPSGFIATDWSHRPSGNYLDQRRWARSLFVIIAIADLRKHWLGWNFPLLLLALHLAAYRNLNCPFRNQATMESFDRASVGTVVFVDFITEPIRSSQSYFDSAWYFQSPCYQAPNTYRLQSEHLNCTFDTNSKYW